jgi:hypothetical protein
MTDKETIRRVLSPPGQQAAQILRDLTVIRRLETVLPGLRGSQRPMQRFRSAIRRFNRGNTGCP